MYQYVAKPDDLGQIGDHRGHIGSNAPQADERLANDLKLAFDGCAQHLVGEVIVEGSAGGKPHDPFHCPLPIPEIFRRCVGYHDVG
jgi:hypothetical protein